MGNKTNKMSSDSTIKWQIINTLQEGDTNSLELLFKDYPDLLNAPLDYRGNTALHLAVQHEGIHSDKHGSKVIEFLLGKGADVNAKNIFEQTPLLVAAMRSPQLIKLLLEKGADVNAQDHVGETSLHYCRFDYESSQLLLERGANVNLVNKQNDSALMLAVKNIEVAKLLLRHGAEIRHVADTRSVNMDQLLFFAKSHKLWELWELENEPNAEGENQQQQCAAANPYKFFSYIQWLPRETLEDTLALIGTHIKDPSSP